MFYYLSKLLDFLIMPYNVLLFGLIVVLITVTKKWLRWFVGGLAICFYLQSNTYVVAGFASLWELPVKEMDKIDKVYDTGIVLSGGLLNSCHQTPGYYDLERGSDRLLAAYFLYKKGVCKRLLLTGTDTDQRIQQGRGEVQLAKKLLMEWGVPEKDILLELEAKNTRENALYTAELLGANVTDANLLITSAYHMRRAVGCFNKVGLKVEPFPADLSISRKCLKKRRKLVPSPDTAADFQRLWREWIGMLMYKLVGYC